MSRTFPISNSFLPGSVLRIQGHVHPNAENISVFLQTGPNYQDDIALLVNPNFNDGLIYRNSRQRGTWGQPETHGGSFEIYRDDTLEILILCEERYFDIAVNGTDLARYFHRIQLLDWINHLRIEGDLSLRLVTFQRNRVSSMSANTGVEILFSRPITAEEEESDVDSEKHSQKKKKGLTLEEAAALGCMVLCPARSLPAPDVKEETSDLKKAADLGCMISCMKKDSPEPSRKSKETKDYEKALSLGVMLPCPARLSSVPEVMQQEYLNLDLAKAAANLGVMIPCSGRISETSEEKHPEIPNSTGAEPIDCLFPCKPNPEPVETHFYTQQEPKQVRIQNLKQYLPTQPIPKRKPEVARIPEQQLVPSSNGNRTAYNGNSPVDMMITIGMQQVEKNLSKIKGKLWKLRRRKRSGTVENLSEIKTGTKNQAKFYYVEDIVKEEIQRKFSGESESPGRKSERRNHGNGGRNGSKASQGDSRSIGSRSKSSGSVSSETDENSEQNKEKKKRFTPIQKAGMVSGAFCAAVIKGVLLVYS